MLPQPAAAADRSGIEALRSGTTPSSLLQRIPDCHKITIRSVGGRYVTSDNSTGCHTGSGYPRTRDKYPDVKKKPGSRSRGVGWGAPTNNRIQKTGFGSRWSGGTKGKVDPRLKRQRLRDARENTRQAKRQLDDARKAERRAIEERRQAERDLRTAQRSEREARR